MCLFRPHELVCVENAEKTAHFIDILCWFLLKDDRNSFLPWFEASWHEPVSKPIDFFDNPCTLEEVNGEAICFKAR